jgi:histidyl-tRNA synthetase
MRLKGLTGFRDFYPADMAFRRWIEDAWHAASRAAGFEEWDGPLLEPLELFTAKSGDEIVGQIYAFADKGGREVSLRPEMTPTLARMVGARAGGLPKPIKWYCVPQSFRYERPQRGRGREFFQWNADVIGSDDPAADAELVAVALDGLRRLGLGNDDLQVRISDRRLLRRMLASIDVGEDQEAAVIACIDRLERDERAMELLEEQLGAERSARIASWCEEMPLNQAPELEAVLGACEEYGIREAMLTDFRIVRGLAYYTGPVWEIFGLGRELRAVAGGGRYDDLIKALGGPDLPAIGFGLGDMVLGELLREKGLSPPQRGRVDTYVVPVGAEMTGPARRVVARLRARGVAADAPYGGARVGKVLKMADQAGARRAVLVGPDEWADGSVRVKDLASGEEKVVPLDELD